MDEKDWFIIKAIHEERNITKAAEKLYTSQPALTYRLQQMEENLKVKLVLRNKKGIKFTPEGEYLVKYANQMILELQKTRDYVLNMNNNIEGIIRIGVSSNFGHYRLPSILKSFLQNYPNVQFNVTTGWSSKINKLIQNEDVHLGIVRGDYTWYGPKVLIEKEHLTIISKENINIEKLPNLPCINYVTDHLLKKIIDDWWLERFSHPPNYTMKVDKIETCKEMVRHGLGYAIIPSICLQSRDREQFHTIHLTSIKGEPIWRDTWLMYQESVLDFEVIKRFIEFISDKQKVDLQVANKRTP